MSALLHQPTYAPLLPSRAKQLWRIARGTTDGPHWQCVWQELYAVARGKRCLPSSSDEQPSSKRQRCDPIVLQERTNIPENQQLPQHIKPPSAHPPAVDHCGGGDSADSNNTHAPSLPPRRHKQHPVFTPHAYSALTSLLDLSQQLLATPACHEPAVITTHPVAASHHPTASTPTTSTLEHPTAAALLMHLAQGPHIEEDDGTPQHPSKGPPDAAAAVIPDDPIHDDCTPQQHQSSSQHPACNHDAQVPSPFDSSQLGTPFRKRVKFDLSATPRIFKYHHFHHAAWTGTLHTEEEEGGGEQAHERGRADVEDVGHGCATEDGAAADGSPPNATTLAAAPELVPIPRRLKYERHRRASTNPAPTRATLLQRSVGPSPARAGGPGGPGAPLVPPHGEWDAGHVQQLFREAYINLKLSTRLHQFQCVWAQCDFDGGDLNSRSHEQHHDAYKEASHRLLVAVGRDAAEVVRQRVEREWQQIKGIRRRTCASSSQALAADLLASQPLPHVSSTTSSTRTRSILKRAASPLVAVAGDDGTPCRRVRLLEGPAGSCPTVLFTGM